MATVDWGWRVKLGGLGLRREGWLLGCLYLGSLGFVFGIQVGVGSGSGICVVLSIGIGFGIFLESGHQIITFLGIGCRVLGSGQVEFVCDATL